MGIAGKDVNDAFSEHAFGPIAGVASKLADERTGSDLHPHARGCQPLDRRVSILDPNQAFGVGQNGDIGSIKNIEKERFHTDRRYMSWKLDQHITTLAQRQDFASIKLGDESRGHVRIGTANQFKSNSRIGKGAAQDIRRGDNLGPGVMIDTWKNVRCTRRNFDAVSDGEVGHLQGRLEIGRSIIQSGKKVTMKVDHRLPR